MYHLIKQFHSFSAYFTLALIVLAILTAYMGAKSQQGFKPQHRKLALAALIISHVQLLLGTAVYFMSPLGFSNFSGESMKNSMTRIYIVEHPMMMVLGIILITIGYVKHKKAIDDVKKFNAILWFYGIGLICILSRIPWSAWI